MIVSSTRSFSIGEDKYKTDKHAQILYSMLQQQQNRTDGLVEVVLGKFVDCTEIVAGA